MIVNQILPTRDHLSTDGLFNLVHEIGKVEPEDKELVIRIKLIDLSNDEINKSLRSLLIHLLAKSEENRWRGDPITNTFSSALEFLGNEMGGILAVEENWKYFTLEPPQKEQSSGKFRGELKRAWWGNKSVSFFYGGQPYGKKFHRGILKGYTATHARVLTESGVRCFHLSKMSHVNYKKYSVFYSARVLVLRTVIKKGKATLFGTVEYEHKERKRAPLVLSLKTAWG